MKTTTLNQTTFSFETPLVKIRKETAPSKVISFEDYRESVRNTARNLSDEIIKKRGISLISHYLYDEAKEM
jgi:hypothetical protein